MYLDVRPQAIRVILELRGSAVDYHVEDDIVEIDIWRYLYYLNLFIIIIIIIDSNIIMYLIILIE